MFGQQETRKDAGPRAKPLGPEVVPVGQRSDAMSRLPLEATINTISQGLHRRCGIDQIFSAASLLADQQNKRSGSDQQGKQNTGDERETTQCRLGLISFDPAPFCAAPMPNQKRSLSIAVSAVIGAALWQYAYDYGELVYSTPSPPAGMRFRFFDRF